MRLAVLPGDDIGPEIVDAALEVLSAADRRFGLGLEFDIHEVGMRAHRTHGTTLPHSALSAAMDADAVILGPAGMTDYPPIAEGGINIPGTIRKRLDLYANIRPARSRPGVADARDGLDCVIVRENTEGFYADRNLFKGYGEFMPTPDCAMSLRVVTAAASRRIAEKAVEVAQQRSGRVTIVGKRHVLQITDGLFHEAFVEAAAAASIEWVEMDIDAMAADLYSRPKRHDVILTSNMFGDILSNLAVALSGGLGLAASLNAGATRAAANAGHGSAPDIAGRNIANPLGLTLSAALLLRWLAGRHARDDLAQAADAIDAAVDRMLTDGTDLTRDLGGSGTTSGTARRLADMI